MLKDPLLRRSIDPLDPDSSVSAVTTQTVEELAFPLLKLGLSLNEAKVYACLVATGASTAAMLSMKAAVPRTKIYEVLRRLANLGLLSKIPGKTTRFSPRAPSEVLVSPLLSLKAHAKDLERTVECLQEAYQRNESDSQLRRAEIWIASGRKAASAILREMLSNAHHDVHILTAGPALTWFYGENLELIEHLKEIGVTTRIGVCLDKPRKGEKSINRALHRILRVLRRSADVNCLGHWPPLTYVCVDGCSFLAVKHIPTDRPDHVGSSSESDEVFFSYRPALCTMMNAVFSSMWNGESIEQPRG